MTRAVVFSLTALFATPWAVAAPPAENSALIGQWEANMQGLPFMRLTVEEEGGKLTGAVLFYLIHRDPGRAPTASPGYPEPMIEPHFDGKTLEFQVCHRFAHPPRTLNDPPVSFRLELAGPDRIKLFAPEPGQPAVELIRVKYK